MGELIRFKSGLYSTTHVDQGVTGNARQATSNYIMGDLSGRLGIHHDQMSYLWLKNDGTQVYWYVEE